MEMWASFGTAAMTEITGIYSCEQPDSVIPFQTGVEATDARYATWYNALVACRVDLSSLPAPESASA